ncbi:MAG: NUDIX domain-containing protein [Oscillospiraceae bacterium]
MKYEKSCGALVIRGKGSDTQLLILKHKYGGHWSFPKGHVENGETEIQTALREVNEETGLTLDLFSGFRQAVEYFPSPNVKKEVVYFLGYAKNDNIKKQEEEISEIKWVKLDEAHKIVTFKNDKNLINQAKLHLKTING